MEFVTDGKVNSKFVLMKEEIIDLSKEIPKNVFKEKYNYFLFLDFDWIFECEFLNSLMIFVSLLQGKKIFLSALNKDEEKKFYENSNKYPTLIIEHSDSYDKFKDAIYHIPFRNSSMSFGDYPNEVLYFSEDSKWAVYGCRDWEIAICGFESEILKNQFERLFKKMLLEDVVEASELAMQLDEYEELRKTFQKNYG